jgi:hypothetical protein
MAPHHPQRVAAKHGSDWKRSTVADVSTPVQTKSPPNMWSKTVADRQQVKDCCRPTAGQRLLQTDSWPKTVANGHLV